MDVQMRSDAALSIYASIEIRFMLMGTIISGPISFRSPFSAAASLFASDRYRQVQAFFDHRSLPFWSFVLAHWGRHGGLTLCMPTFCVTRRNLTIAGQICG